MATANDRSPSVPEAVSWSEGMLLSPQHFQQNDIYWHALLRHHVAVAQPDFWGVIELAIDATQLAKGRLVVERLRGVMDDGLLVEYPGFYAPQALELDLSGHDWSARPQVTVHLRVPVRGRGAASDIGDMQRYTTERGALEADEHNTQDEIEIDRLRPKLSLVAADSVATSYCSFPLLALRGDARGVHLTDFHPPMTRLSASDFQGGASLRERLAGLSAALWAKYRELLGVRAGDYPSLADETNPQVRAARCLAMAMPAFDVLLKAGNTHPATLYAELARLVGFVAATPGAPQPPALDAYRHADCMPQFQQAIEYVRAQLSRLNADYHVLEFEQIGAAGFRCALPRGIDTSTLYVELRPRSGQTGTMLGGWLDSARIANEDLIYTLVKRRFPGAGIQPADARRVAALNLRAGSFVYAVSNGHIELDDGGRRPLIADDRNLVVLGEPGDAVPAAMLLYLPRAGRGDGAA